MERLELFLRACSHQCPKISTICVCAFIYLFMCVYIYTYVCIYVYMYVKRCLYMSTHVFVSMNRHICIYIDMSTHISICYILASITYAYTCQYIYMYQCTHVRYMCVYVRVVLNSFTRKKTSSLNKNLLSPNFRHIHV